MHHCLNTCASVQALSFSAHVTQGLQPQVVLLQRSKLGAQHYTGVGRALGNTEPGDGAKFRGRGPLQLTGRGNYAACDAAIHVGIVDNPEAVASDPRVGFQTAGWFWKLRRINVAADARSWGEGYRTGKWQ